MKSGVGPIYGVKLIDTLPLDNGSMLQQMPSRQDLDDVRQISERTVAGYEVLLGHWNELRKLIGECVTDQENAMDVLASNSWDNVREFWKRLEDGGA